jgi:O-antigen ligase
VGNQAWFVGILGGWLGLCLVKFGNPVILDRYVHRPEGLLEVVFNPWPLPWAFTLAAVVVALAPLTSILGQRTTRAPRSLPPPWVAFVLLLPVLWYVWQWIASFHSVDSYLTRTTLVHFTFCIAFLGMGWFCMPLTRNLKPFLIGLLSGFTLVLWVGFDQRFGGLEATRQMLYESEGWNQYPPEFLARLERGRIFGTLFYPNALAGCILLLFPWLIWSLHQMTSQRSNIIRGTAVGLLSYGAVACLFWSQSKAGWLVAVVMVFITFMQLPISRTARWTGAIVIAALALATFGLRFADYFERGAASASARIDYWQAAWQTAKSNPVLGTGPGTFQIPYATLKRPESEMARLAHNDYLQQASDSGFVGMVLYTSFVLGSLLLLYGPSRLRPEQFAVWLGLTGWALHGVVEFGLYIPAIAWPAFTMFGWLWATSGQKWLTWRGLLATAEGS